MHIVAKHSALCTLHGTLATCWCIENSYKRREAIWDMENFNAEAEADMEAETETETGRMAALREGSFKRIFSA